MYVRHKHKVAKRNVIDSVARARNRVGQKPSEDEGDTQKMKSN
jgi:hypothetical protein